MTPEFLAEIVNRHALANDLRPDVVMCVIIKESSVNTFANRIEQRYVEMLQPLKRDEISGWKPKPEQVPTLSTEKHNRSQSWGLMQVMGETARWCAKLTDPYLTVMLDPDRGVEAGCKVLSFYLHRQKGNYQEALSCYNAGRVCTQGLIYAAEIYSLLDSKAHLKYLK